MRVAHVVNDLVAFLWEVLALGVLAWWGWSAVGPVWLKVVAAVGVPGAAATLWGLFAASRARFRVPSAVVNTVLVTVFRRSASYGR